MSRIHIIGAYNTKFGNFVKKNKETGETSDLQSLYHLMVEAGRGALRDAGLPASDIGGVWVGSCAPGLFAHQEHLAAFATEIDPEGLRFKPMTRCEAACASGSVALYDAIHAVESGRIKAALVLGVEKMNLLDTRGVTHALATCSYWPEEGSLGMTFPGLFAEYAKGYQAHHRLDNPTLRHMLASVSAHCYKNGVENPMAHFGRGGPSDRQALFTAQAILDLPDEKNPLVAAPLRLHDCSLVTDGAAALVIVAPDHPLARSPRAVRIAGIGHANERLAISQRTNMHSLLAARHAASLAYAEAGIQAADIHIAEVHDCFTINQILCTEALGLSPEGRAGHDYIEGRFGPSDQVSINLSGGLKAKGHPVGATGVSMHALLYKQLIGEAVGQAPAKRPQVAATLSVGGSAATNCVTVLTLP